MRRLPGILVLLVGMLALSSGAARYLHETHAHSHGSESEQHDIPVPHDESNCLIHALLKLPMLGGEFVPLLVFVGLFVAFLSLIPTPVRSRRPILQLDCRGPPDATPAVVAM